MRLFKRRGHTRYGVAIDIESGSVGIAIVAWGTGTSQKVIWNARTVMPLRKKITEREARANVCSVLHDAVRMCGSMGLQALAHHDPSARVATISVSIAAPWSQTVTQTITITRDRPFTITTTVLKEAARKAERATAEALGRDQHAAEHVSILESTLIALSANGYTIENPLGIHSKSLTATIAVEIADKELMEAITDDMERTFPRVPVRTQTYMHMLYASLRSMRLDTTHACLIDVTGEATEIGIVRENILTHVSHTPYGVDSLSRAVADLLNIPLGEALAHLRSGAEIMTKGAALDDVMSLYRTNLGELFGRVGGTLALPRTIFLHTDTGADTFLSSQIGQAARELTGQIHKVQIVTGHYFDLKEPAISPFLLSAQALGEGEGSR